MQPGGVRSTISLICPVRFRLSNSSASPNHKCVAPYSRAATSVPCLSAHFVPFGTGFTEHMNARLASDYRFAPNLVNDFLAAVGARMEQDHNGITEAPERPQACTHDPFLVADAETCNQFQLFAPSYGVNSA